MEISETQISRELSEINSRIPKDWLDKVVYEIAKTPTIEKVMKQSIQEKILKPETESKVKELLNAGYFSQKKLKENKVYAKLIDQFVKREINKKIKIGLLPPRSRKLPHFENIYKKILSEKHE